MARLVLPSRLELNIPEGSASAAPLAKVSFDHALQVSPVQMMPSWYHTGTPRHFHSRRRPVGSLMTRPTRNICRASPRAPRYERRSGPAPSPRRRSSRAISPRCLPPPSSRRGYPSCIFRLLRASNNAVADLLFRPSGCTFFGGPNRLGKQKMRNHHQIRGVSARPQRGAALRTVFCAPSPASASRSTSPIRVVSGSSASPKSTM